MIAGAVHGRATALPSPQGVPPRSTCARSPRRGHRILHQRPVDRPSRGGRGGADREHHPGLPRPHREPAPLRPDLVGTGAAIVVSLARGRRAVRHIGGLESPYEQIFEGLAMLAARRSSSPGCCSGCGARPASVKSELHAAVDRALTGGTVGGSSCWRSRRSSARASRRRCSWSARRPRRIPAPGRPARRPGRARVAALLGVGFYRGARLIDLASSSGGRGSP